MPQYNDNGNGNRDDNDSDDDDDDNGGDDGDDSDKSTNTTVLRAFEWRESESIHPDTVCSVAKIRKLLKNS